MNLLYYYHKWYLTISIKIKKLKAYIYNFKGNKNIATVYLRDGEIYRR